MANPTIVQSSSAFVSAGGTINFSSTTAGNYLFALFTGGTSPGTVTDNHSQTYDQICGVSDATNGNGSWIYYCLNAAGGAIQISQGSAAGGTAAEISNVGNLVYDGAPGATAFNVTPVSSISQSVGTLTNSNDLVLAVINPNQATDVITPTNGATALVNDSLSYYCSMRSNPSSGAQSITASTTSDYYTIAAVAITGSSGGSNTGITPTVGADALNGIAPTVTKPLVDLIQPLTARRRFEPSGAGVLVPERRIFLPSRRRAA